MEYTRPIISQVCIMILLASMGYICYKAKVINAEANKHLSKLLLSLVLPIWIIASFQKEYQSELANNLALTFLLGIITFILSIIVSYLCFRKPSEQQAIDQFSASYPNSGYLGLPLITAALGGEGAFYLTAIIACFNILAWTHGVILITGMKITNIKSVTKKLLSPNIIAIFIGLALFLLKIKLPDVIFQSFSLVGNMTTPLAMIITGVTLAQTNLLKAIVKKQVYLVSLIRLLLFPLALLLILSNLSFIPTPVLLTVVIAFACPTATVVLSFAIIYNKDYLYASELLAITTLFSVFTLPLIVWLSGFVL